MDFPIVRLNRPVIGSLSPECIGIQQRQLSGSGTVASSTWPGNNRALYLPLVLAAPFQVSKVWWANGATVSANVDCGIYSAGGTLLAAIGSTVQAGASVVQSAALSLLLMPGSYQIALVLSSTAGTIQRWGTAVRQCQMLGVTQEALGSTALPATATPATVANSFLPIFGISRVAVI